MSSVFQKVGNYLYATYAIITKNAADFLDHLNSFKYEDLLNLKMWL